MQGSKTFVAVAIVMVVSAGRGFAQPAAAQAEVLFKEGRELMSKGQFPEACAAFEQSQALDPAVTTLMNLASCREKNSQFATAWGLFVDAERQTREATDAAGKQLHSIAHNLAAKLEPRVSKLTISVPVTHRIPGLAIDRDAEHIVPAVWNIALPVDGGTYVITASATGVPSWHSTVVVANEGEVKIVEIPDLRHQESPTPPTPSNANAPIATGKAEPTGPVANATTTSATVDDKVARDDPGFRGSPTLTIGVGAGTVALLGTALVFDLWGDSTYAKAKAAQDSSRSSLERQANEHRHLAVAFGGAGLAAASLTLYLYIAQHRRTESKLSTISKHFAASPSGISWIGVFP